MNFDNIKKPLQLMLISMSWKALHLLQQERLYENDITPIFAQRVPTAKQNFVGKSRSSGVNETALFP